MQLTLLVSKPSDTADHLRAVLASDGMDVRQLTPEQALTTEWGPPGGVPDLLLVNAGLDLVTVRSLLHRLGRAADRPPTVVTFVDDRYADLEPYVRAGLDYIVPPYVPKQVRDRLVASQLRQLICPDSGDLQSTTALLRYEQELAIGREIQLGFLPDGLPTPAGWNFTARFLPAREVSGDFYDAFEMLDGRRIALVVADVCDKGVGAALFMALIRSLLRHTAVYLETSTRDRAGHPPDADAERRRDEEMLMRAVTSTNDYLIKNHMRQAYFATLFFAILDPETGSLVFVNCGHNPPLIRRHNGDVMLLHPTGPALGLIPQASFRPASTTLEPGDLFFGYTDGVTEARNTAGVLLGEAKMTAIVCTDATSARETLNCVERCINEHAGVAEQADDITMMAVHRDLAVMPVR
ncbi:PP2C family protein-serine/threonine phosphatase [Actinoplanes sp. NEAU-A12]|uniref:PP2C family protein-serine/threonine phosphatase n=1 Tax=Actinoplanes sandaracinus TaxID=3045177 RepID=A0ABT6WL34_9ACTN|nr:PP2C family protein-serine/threonine phosphatase [Actinoplanes sandaracinus]MDI6100434.1 PP2C family protein-serine/threonine phosphatase [Actinoplanes sandaracinus]